MAPVLDQLVTFRAPLNGRNSLNEVIAGGWETVAQVLAARTPVRDAERNTGAQVEREISDRFVTHWTPTLAALNLTQQLVDRDGVAFDLVGRKALDRDMRSAGRVWLEWSCQARDQEAPP